MICEACEGYGYRFVAVAIGWVSHVITWPARIRFRLVKRNCGPCAGTGRLFDVGGSG